MTPQGNPDPAAIDDMVAAFRKYSTEHPNAQEVDMTKPDIVGGYKEPDYCGTPGCHGGLYAVIHLDADELDGHYVDFDNGANLMYKHLMGFDSEEGGNALSYWAANNPVLWGNECGGLMFQHNHAFAMIDPYDNLPIALIADHWEGVAQRIRQAEAKQ